MLRLWMHQTFLGFRSGICILTNRSTLWRSRYPPHRPNPQFALLFTDYLCWSYIITQLSPCFMPCPRLQLTPCCSEYQILSSMVRILLHKMATKPSRGGIYKSNEGIIQQIPIAREKFMEIGVRTSDFLYGTIRYDMARAIWLGTLPI